MYRRRCQPERARRYAHTRVRRSRHRPFISTSRFVHTTRLPSRSRRHGVRTAETELASRCNCCIKRYWDSASRSPCARTACLSHRRKTTARAPAALCESIRARPWPRTGSSYIELTTRPIVRRLAYRAPSRGSSLGRRWTRSPLRATHGSPHGRAMASRSVSLLRRADRRRQAGRFRFCPAGPRGLLNAWPLNEAYIDTFAMRPCRNRERRCIRSRALARRSSNNARDDEADVTTGYHAIEFLLWGQDFNPHGPGAPRRGDFVGAGRAARRRDVS